MKTPLVASLLSLGAAFSVAAVESAVPQAFPESRYHSMIARSPFALATPVAPPVTADKGFADGWYLSSATQIDGKDFINVRSRDLSVQLSLYGNEERDGVKLRSVEWSSILGQTTATIEKDGQFAKLEMLSAGEMAAATPPAPAPNQSVRVTNNINARTPGAFPQAARPQGAFPQPARPQSVIPQPIPRPQGIPRPSSQPMTPPAPVYQVAPTTTSSAGSGIQVPANVSEGRRRIRTITSTPAQ